jgi:hypothetical protein
VKRYAWITRNFDSFLFAHDMLNDFLISDNLVFLENKFRMMYAWIWYFFWFESEPVEFAGENTTLEGLLVNIQLLICGD